MNLMKYVTGTFRREPRWRSLATRLLTLTVLWVSFIVGAIGYMMMLSWKVQDIDALTNSMASTRAAVYQLDLIAGRQFNGIQFDLYLARVDQSIQVFEGSKFQKMMQGDRVARVHSEAMEIVRDWRHYVRPAFLRAEVSGELVEGKTIQNFAARLRSLEEIVKTECDELLTQIRHIQIVLMLLSICSLFVILFLLVHWVIEPTETLRHGMRAISDGQLRTRVSLWGSLEFERIGEGFNAMAQRLQELVERLEEKVNEKTRALDVQNRHLSQLYEVTRYFTRSRPVGEMSEGFVKLLERHLTADAVALYLSDQHSGRAELMASAGLDGQILARLTNRAVAMSDLEPLFAGDAGVFSIFARSTTALIWPDSVTEAVREHFARAYAFPVKTDEMNYGFFILYFKSDRELSDAVALHYESFGSHLAIALESRRYFERERQFAIVQERSLMAQGLHDSIAQTLSFLNLQVQVLESSLNAKDEKLTADTVNCIKDGVKESYENVRELLLNFRERVHKESFAQAVSVVIDRFEMQSNINVTVRQIGTVTDYPERIKLQVIFILQEALSNIRKHARASAVYVTLDTRSGLVMTVTDNGVGISQELLSERGLTHVGLNIMRERAERIGAELSVDAAPESISPTGTCIMLRLASDRLGH